LVNYRNLSIIVTMLVSFLLSLAFMHGRGRSYPPTPVPQRMPVAAIGGGEVPDVPRALDAQPPAPIPQSQSRVSRPQLRPAQSEESAQGEERPDGPVPALLMIAKRGGRLQGSIRNQREEALQVTISEISPQLGQVAQIQMTLDSNENRSFGAEDGLEMRWHDRLVVHAPGFIDRDSLIP